MHGRFNKKGGVHLRIIVGMNGTTGVIYGIRLLQVLSDMDDTETHLVISRACEQTIEIETDFNSPVPFSVPQRWAAAPFSRQWLPCPAET